MTETPTFRFILFDSTSETLLAEKLLKKTGISHKVIPVPRHISSDCGVCIRISFYDTDRTMVALKSKVHFRAVSPVDL